MTIKIYNGRITLLGDSVSSGNATASATTYSYIELANGDIIRRVKTLMGLDGQLRSAFREDEVVELHFNEILTGVPDPGSVLLAIRRGNGKLYASFLPVSSIYPSYFSIIPIAVFLFGIFTIPFLGIGFVFLYYAWKLHKIAKDVAFSRALYSEAQNHIKSLNGAIEI